MKLCVFPNGPLSAWYDKGSIKPRYFNPKNIFDEIHAISLFDKDIEEEKVKTLAGEAEFKIYVVGKVNSINKKYKKKEILKLVNEIKPDVMRTHDPLLQGWMAAQIKKELNIPLVISLHSNYDIDHRYLARKNRDYKNYFKLLYTQKTLEPFSLKNADEVIIIHEFLRKYATKMGAKSINLIHNRIDTSQFTTEGKPAFKEEKPVVICVGRLIKIKNQECLIRAVKDLDVILMLVGDGEEYQNLVKLTQDLGMENKVRFERSIPHEKIQDYYSASDIFALPMTYGGFAIPPIEAAASGLPVILPKQEFDSNPDVISDFALLVDNNPSSFKAAIQKLLSDNEFRDEHVKKGLEVTKKINGDVMEEKEKDLYLKLLQKN